MCGRYYRKGDKQKIVEAFHAHLVDDGTPSPPWDYNIAPTIQPIIRNDANELMAHNRVSVILHPRRLRPLLDRDSDPIGRRLIFCSRSPPTRWSPSRSAGRRHVKNNSRELLSSSEKQTAVRSCAALR